MGGYKLIRSKRKTIAICIDREGNVTVRAPLKAPSTVIERFVGEKQEWISQKTALMINRKEERAAFRFGPGSELPLLGRSYPIALGNEASFDGQRFILPSGDGDSVRPQLMRLYKDIAGKMILSRVEMFSSRTGWVPTGVRIGSANTSWGSCSGKNRLNFTWKLVTAEPGVIDYVIVHELAHLKEHNHSEKFWRLVESVLPDYRKRRAKLRELEEKLQKIGLS